MNKTEKQDQDPQLQKTPFSESRFVPMLFSSDMVQAILNGTKTETRRKIDVYNSLDYLGFIIGDSSRTNHIAFGNRKTSTTEKVLKLKANVGDVIWVRETFVKYDVVGKNGIETEIEYKADEPAAKFKWKPSLFMPKIACRIFLKCVSVHVEKLHYIDEQGAINEGIENLSADEFKVNLFRNYLRSEKEINYQDFTTDNPILSYQTLWQKINGKDSWDLNPYVFVYKFERIERPYDFR